MSSVVEAKELSCFYGVVLGLNNVSFEISSGITGLVGPNGAGKSTLIKLITGQIKPSAGCLRVYGQDTWNNPDLLRRIGYCPEHEYVHKELKPVDWLESLGTLSGLSLKQAKQRSGEALERVQLDKKHWKKRIGAYSKGMRQRVKLAQALMHRPDLVILDEPMNGLDPMGRQEIGNLLKSLKEQGVDIIISSHILHELESMCSGFLMLNWGRALASGGQRKIREDLQSWSEEIGIRTNDPESLASVLRDTDTIKGYLVDGDHLIVWLKDPEVFFRNWTDYLKDCEVEIYDVQSRSHSLSNIFEQVVK
ncbi:MAG: ABC transporter ATP-binding protein [Verrucomicrobiota bacterium]